MADYILKSGSSLLKSGNFILVSSDDPPTPSFDFNAETFTKTVNGQQVAPANNDKLPILTDAVSGAVFRQDDVAKQGLFVTNAVNGKPAMRFSAAYYESAVSFPAKTIFVVARATVQTQQNGALFAGNVGSHGYFLGDDGIGYFREDTGAGTDMFGLNTNKNRLFVNRAQAEPKGGASRQLYYTLMTLDVADTALATNIFRIGASYNPVNPPQLFYFQGEIARIIAYPMRLTEAHRLAKREELMTYYNL